MPRLRRVIHADGGHRSVGGDLLLNFPLFYGQATLGVGSVNFRSFTVAWANEGGLTCIPSSTRPPLTPNRSSTEFQRIEEGCSGLRAAEAWAHKKDSAQDRQQQPQGEIRQQQAGTRSAGWSCGMAPVSRTKSTRQPYCRRHAAGNATEQTLVDSTHEASTATIRHR